MSGGFAAQTIYSVVTRFEIDDKATAPARRVRREVEELDRRTKSTALGFGMIARYIGPMLSMAAAIGVTRRVISGLNEQTNRTIQLASQFSLAFKFDADPAKQFAASMRESQKLVREIIRDAASLPGESRDFFGILALTSGVSLRVGGAQAARRLTSNIALASPFAGQGPEEAGRQAFRMLSGQTSIGDNPLFAMLTSSGLLPNAKTFNALSLTQRFEALDAALQKLVGNLEFRNAVIMTLDTQWSSLMENLFGPMGIGGQLLTGPFNDFVPALARLNAGLQENIPGIVAGLQNLGHLFSWTNPLPLSWMTTPMLGGEQVGIRAGQLGKDAMMQLLDGANVGALPTSDREMISGLLSNYFNTSLNAPGSLSEEKIKQAMHAIRARIGGREVSGSDVPLATGITIPQVMEIISGSFNKAIGSGGGPGELRNEAAPSVTNTFHVKIDLKSDVSPEAVAMKFAKGIEKLNWMPNRARRGMPLLTPRSTVTP